MKSWGTGQPTIASGCTRPRLPAETAKLLSPVVVTIPAVTATILIVVIVAVAFVILVLLATIFLVALMVFQVIAFLPLVLAALSVAGILLGILLRVRGFLVLGTSFLGLALVTMIWHAAWNLNQTWVWSVSGIVAGMLIIALFALFEKKRQEVLRLVDQLKEWEA